MNETHTAATPTTAARPRVRWGWRKRVAVALLVMAGLAAGLVLLLFYLADREWREAVAEADRLDPGWTCEDLEARRAAIPDRGNAAHCAKTAHQLLPDPWPPMHADDAAAGEAIARSLGDLHPPAPLSAPQIAAITAALAAAQPALAEARRLKDLPNGRYPLAPDELGIPNSWPANWQARKVAVLLTYDALLREQEHDIDGALESCRALLNLARSFGDEPSTSGQLTRLDFCVRTQCAALSGPWRKAGRRLPASPLSRH
jgi:hypothetical protein